MKTLNVIVIGPKGHGKTALCYSLIKNIRRLNRYEDGKGSPLGGLHPGVCYLRENYRDVTFAEWLDIDELHERFTAKGEWPDGTLGNYLYEAEYRVEPYKRDKHGALDRSVKAKPYETRLRLLDVPGELLCDLDVLRAEGFEDWSDRTMTEWAKGGKRRKRIVHDYEQELKSIINQKQNAEDLIKEIIKTFQRFTELEKQDGSSAAGAFHSGPASLWLDREKPSLARNLKDIPIFAPIPRSIRDIRADMVKELEARFRKYRKHVAIPFGRELLRSNHVVLAIAVPRILERGVAEYNDVHRMVCNLKQWLDENRPRFRTVLFTKAHTIPGAGVFDLVPAFRKARQLTVALTQCDRVQARDHRRLEALGEDLLDELKGLSGHLEPKFCPVSAIRCFRDESGHNQQSSIAELAEAAQTATLTPVNEQGYACSPPPGAPPVSLIATRVPKEWPADWGGGGPHYKFPATPPLLSPRTDAVPCTLGFDQLIGHLFDSNH